MKLSLPLNRQKNIQLKKTLSILQNTLKVLFSATILWFLVYFIWGEQLSLYFTSRSVAEVFPQILVFAASVSIYGLFILAIKNNRKKWVNLSLFLGGLLLASLPLLAYHGYFQYQCGFWNQKVQSTKKLFVHQKNPSETIQVLQTTCENTMEDKLDTIYSKKITPFLEVHHKVKIRPVENSDWMLPVHFKQQ